jgi:hypothetical protein
MQDEFRTVSDYCLKNGVVFLVGIGGSQGNPRSYPDSEVVDRILLLGYSSIDL